MTDRKFAEIPKIDHQEIIWREWRNCQDRAYARHLFELVADQPAGWWAGLSLIGLGMLIGITLGGLVQIYLAARLSLLVFLLAGALVGGAAGFAAWQLLAASLTWRGWLPQLVPVEPNDGFKLFDDAIGAVLSFITAPLYLAFYIYDPKQMMAYEGNWFSRRVLLLLAALVAGLYFLFLVALGDFFFGTRIVGLLLILVFGIGFNLSVTGHDGMVLGLGFGLLLEIGLIGIGLLFNVFTAGGLFAAGLGLCLGLLAGSQVRARRQKDITLSRTWCLWWPDRPHAGQVEAAIRHFCEENPAAAGVWQRALADLDEQLQDPPAPETLLGLLQEADWEERFAARQTLYHLDWRAFVPLVFFARNRNLRIAGPATWILKSIEAYNEDRLAKRAPNLFCPHCLARFQRAWAELSPLHRVSYYGCRLCGQNDDLASGEIVAVLDNRTQVEQLRDGKRTGVNWLVRRELFDFDEVHILQAHDEAVERFVIQIGNDTDEFRRPRYGHIKCIIGSACRLNENTRRILESHFGMVTDEAAGPQPFPDPRHSLTSPAG